MNRVARPDFSSALGVPRNCRYANAVPLRDLGKPAGAAKVPRQHLGLDDEGSAEISVGFFASEKLNEVMFHKSFCELICGGFCFPFGAKAAHPSRGCSRMSRFIPLPTSPILQLVTLWIFGAPPE